MGRDFTVSWTTENHVTYQEGFGVYVEPVWDEDEQRVADIVVTVVPIREDLVRIVGNVPCVPLPEAFGMMIPVANFRHVDDLWQDDTHDLRDRFFETEEQAREHESHTLRRWEHPAPWESFVAV